jgi:uncharacterized protein with GYD domain
MHLDDFVSQSIIQITQGVLAAQKELESTGAAVNPLMRKVENHDAAAVAEMRAGETVSTIRFDVAVSASSGQEAKGGIGVVSGVFNLGSAGKSEHLSETISRIQFSIPIIFPIHRKQVRTQN